MNQFPPEYDDLRTQLACACDLVNGWSRESGVAEVKDPYGGLGLREGIDRLWGKLSSRESGLRRGIDDLRSENERLLRAVEALSASEAGAVALLEDFASMYSAAKLLPQAKWLSDDVWRRACEFVRKRKEAENAGSITA